MTTAILFVCMGNICRSPVAEGLFRQRMEALELGDRFSCDSAGTHDYHVGKPPDPRAIEAARRARVDISGQRARHVEADDFEHFDWIVCMDSDCCNQLLQQFDNLDPGRMRRLFAHEDVIDPYYGGERSFCDMLRHLQEGIDGLMQDLVKKTEENVRRAN